MVMDIHEFIDKLEEAWDRLDYDFSLRRLNLCEEDYEYESFRKYLNSLPVGDALYLFTQRFPHG